MSNEIAVKQVGTVAGIEGVDSRDYKRGNIVLVQENAKYFRKAGLKPGTFVNATSLKPIEDPTFIPCYLTKYYDVYNEVGDKMVWAFRTINENDVRMEGKRWRTEGKSKAEIIPVLALVALIDKQPVSIAFKKASGYPAGQKLFTMASEKNAPLYAFTYRLNIKESIGKGGDTYYAIDVSEVGPTDEKLIPIAAELSKSLSGKRSQVAQEAEAMDAGDFDR